MIRADATAAPLSSHQRLAIGIFALGAMFEFFDNYVIAFVLAFIVRPWALTNAQSATILLASGMGGLAGSLLWGWYADRFGRKQAFVASLLVTAAASLLLTLTPEGNWQYLAIVRTLIGVGVGGFFVPIILVQEMVPAGRKGYASGILSSAAASGLVLGALSAATLSAIIGWRGLFLIGLLPAVISVMAFRLLPESPRWLRDHGRNAEADQAQRWITGDAEAPSCALPGPLPAPNIALAELSLSGSPRRALLAGVATNAFTLTGYTALVMWSPTLIAQVQSIAPGQAARLMVIVSILGMLSRLTIGRISDWIGRRRAGIIVGLGAAACIMLAATVARGQFLLVKSFWICIAACFVFADAAFAVLAAYTAEIFTPSERGRLGGICYAAGGVGKVVGPLGFALAIGATNVLKPEVTVSSIMTGFGFVAALFASAAASYAFFHPNRRVLAPSQSHPRRQSVRL